MRGCDEKVFGGVGMTLYNLRDQDMFEKGREIQKRESICRLIMTKRFSNEEIADFVDASVEMVDSIEKELLMTEE